VETERRTVHVDIDLGIEAYHFEGIMQKFPNHFHEHYVIGFIESGRRFLVCKNKEYTVEAGDLLLFNPLDSHACEQVDGKTLDWRCLNIDKEIMRRVGGEITGTDEPPVFTTNVARQSDAVSTLKQLHSSIMSEDKDFDKEENFYFLIEQLLSEYTRPVPEETVPTGTGILAVSEYIEKHYAEAITLSDLSRISGVNKYRLLRSFTLQKGITPYQYLSTTRVNNAKALLEAGMPLIEVAAQTGFADQSHFTRFFKNFIGLTPRMYQSLFRAGGGVSP
jgi:AraC-like DNA-binding protein